ncbi:MAG: hypothetical protein HON32_00425 [Francisellaceae bacterium]|nr:hypothetical protein [Francisellaceae bacterium]MBT6538752.1 hypothetical protein [Francisellaceae bacterium]
MTEFFSGCEIGQRAINQDFHKSYSDNDIVVAIVADGLGAYKGSEIASQAFCELFISTTIAEKHQLTHNPEHIYDIIFEAASKTISILLHNRVVEACTAFALVVVTKNHIIKSHVGDCRIYSMSDTDEIIHTQDHSIAVGPQQSDDFIAHSGILTNVIGPSSEINPDIQIVANDNQATMHLLCSDGFWSHLSQTFIRKFYNAKNKNLAIKPYIKMLKDNKLDLDNLTYLVFER